MNKLKTFHLSTATITPIIEREREKYNVSSTYKGPNACSHVGVDRLGIKNVDTVYHNLTFQQLFEHEIANKEGVVVAAEYGETFAVDTGKFTGRSPRDKWIVKNVGSESEKNIDWGKVNQPVSPQVFDKLYNKAIQHFNTKEKIYIFDCYCGANSHSQKKIRFVHEMAWQQHFVTNMFIRPVSNEELKNFDPDFTVINACSQCVEDWKELGLQSDVAIAFNIEEKVAVIFGTW